MWNSVAPRAKYLKMTWTAMPVKVVWSKPKKKRLKASLRTKIQEVQTADSRRQVRKKYFLTNGAKKASRNCETIFAAMKIAPPNSSNPAKAAAICMIQ